MTKKKSKNLFRKKIKIILLILLGIILLLVIFNWDRFKPKKAEVLDEKNITENIVAKRKEALSQSVIKSESGVEERKGEVEEIIKIKKKKEPEEGTEIPNKIQREISFVSQAPFAVWDELHEEACEEASLIMVKYYLNGKSLTKQKMEDEIQDLVNYQIEKYGDYKDSNVKELKKIAEDYYQMGNIKIIEDFTKNDLKKYLINNLIIIPAAGRELGNPNFTSLGPLYHSLVLIGYKGDNIITNDPGTRNGKNYIYDIDVLFNAIHDFPGSKKKILSGKKAMLLFPLN